MSSGAQVFFCVLGLEILVGVGISAWCGIDVLGAVILFGCVGAAAFVIWAGYWLHTWSERQGLRAQARRREQGELE